MLRPGLFAPIDIARLTVIGLSLTGAAVYAISRPAPAPAQAGVPALAIHASETIALDVPLAAATEAPPIAQTGARSLSLVFAVGDQAYVKLAEYPEGEKLPKHGRAKYQQVEWVETAIAPIALGDVPEQHAAWFGRQVVVDGTCTATVTGFELVARLTGSTGYAYGEAESEGWNAKTVMHHGSRVLAAKLDGCKTGVYARDAALPAAIVPSKVEDVQLAAAAKRKLLRSKMAHAATAEWNGFYANESAPSTWDKDPSTTWKMQVLWHPATNERFVSVHAYQMEGCGSPNINVWALYRVHDDGSLTQVANELGDILEIEQLIDLDGDGTLEVIGTAWLGARIVTDARGAELDRMEVPFYGCPC